MATALGLVRFQDEAAYRQGVRATSDSVATSEGTSTVGWKPDTFVSSPPNKQSSTGPRLRVCR